MAKILFISNISYHINSFAAASILAAKGLSLEFFHAANWEGAVPGKIQLDEAEYNIKIENVHISRNPYSRTNLRAYKELANLTRRENIEYIHCNTPVGGLLGRLVGKKCKVKKVIYQAHGFHFYQGASLKNWMFYYPVEKLLARHTDAVITINQEDYQAAKKFKLKKSGKVYFVHGVGITLEDFKGLEQYREEKRAELLLREDDIALISMGDLVPRKNYAVALQAIAKANNPHLQYFICGKGPDLENLKLLAKELGIQDQVHFLGFRTDVRELLQAVDGFLFTSLQEGLPRSMMEAMASGLPCIVSKIRGNVDLMEDGKGGYFCSSNDVDAFAEAIKAIADNEELRNQMREYNLERIKDFDISVVEKEIRGIYEEVLGEDAKQKLG